MVAEQNAPLNPVFWIGPTRKVMRCFPVPVRDQFGFAIYQAQRGGKHVAAKPLRGIGGGVVEVVADYDGGAYRAVYTVRFAGAIYVLHAFQKKSKQGIRTPKHEIDLIGARLRIAQEQHERWLRERQSRR